MTKNEPTWIKDTRRLRVPTGKSCLELMESRLNEDYVYGADVDLTDPNWHGPWDCAEAASWVIYQETGKLYGCLESDSDNPDP
jgi:N-acetylmuramoyl-L-alanine amidase